jgi:hypothetical protein
MSIRPHAHTARLVATAAIANTYDERRPVSSLHNSGPAPGHVYSTGAVGTELNLSAQQTVRALLAQVRIRRVLRYYHWHEARYLSPAFISGAAYAALCLLSADKHHPARGDLKRIALSLRDIPKLVAAPHPSDLGVALAAITSLKSHLQTCGQLTPFTGIARWSANGSPSISPRAPWIADSDKAPLEQLAWQLVAISHAAPPLVLFSRSPSLEYFRDAGVLTLRWFGARTSERSNP